MPTKKSLLTSVNSDSSKGRRYVEISRAQYDKAELDEDAAQRLNEHPGFATYLAEGIRRFSAKAPDYTLAQSILGADFITPEEVTKFRPSIIYTAEQITALAGSLPSEDVFKWCRDNGYAVIPAPPAAMSLLDVREIQTAHFYSKTGGWYAGEKFAREDKTSFGWLAIRKMPVPNSTSKNWNEQSNLLSAIEKVPNAAEMSWFITTFFEVHGVRFFEGIYVRTSSLVSYGGHVDVGFFDGGGLDVFYWRGDRADPVVGLSAGRK